MKSVSLFVGFCVTAGCSIGFASAQDAGPIGGPPPLRAPVNRPNAGAIEREIIGKLGLSPDQMKQVNALEKKLAQDLKAIRQDPNLTDKQMSQQKQRDARKEYLDELQKLFTPDQAIQYRQLHREYQEKQKAATAAGAKPTGG